MFASFTSLGLVLLPFVSAVVHDIQVGADGKLQFYPEAIAANPGDQVVFHFASKNHTATQSSFASPCGLKEGGFDSGFMPVAANQTDNFPTHTITVQDTTPIWVYCRQKQPFSHCGAGMVFAVNCGSDGSPTSFTGFKQAALAFGAAQSSASPAATPYASAGGDVAGTTAAYGGYSVPAAPSATPVTQPATTTGSPDSTPVVAEAAIHTIKVGGPGIIAFNPPSIQAKLNDVVVFEFQQKNHSVTQSSFGKPCNRLNVNGTSGFDSGFMPVPDDATTFPTWNFTVTGTDPVWAYCRQPSPSSHCGAGMVFAINAVETSEKNFTAFQNVAKTLNGTAAAANAPSSGTSLRLSGATATVVIAAALALVL